MIFRLFSVQMYWMLVFALKNNNQSSNMITRLNGSFWPSNYLKDRLRKDVFFEEHSTVKSNATPALHKNKQVGGGKCVASSLVLTVFLK